MVIYKIVYGSDFGRIGACKVIEIEADRMTVKYKDGSESNLKMGIQERIWLNIVAEKEAENSRSRKKKTTISKANHFIKSIEGARR